MKNGKMRRFLAGLMCLVMVVGLMPVTAGAAELADGYYYIGDGTNFVAADGSASTELNACYVKAYGDGYSIYCGEAYLVIVESNNTSAMYELTVSDTAYAWQWDGSHFHMTPATYGASANYICFSDADNQWSLTTDSSAALTATMVDSGSTAAITMGTKPSDGTTSGKPFIKGTPTGCNSFRIPAMVTLSDGTIVAAADARWNTTYDGGGLDTIVARSSDDGATWNYTFANYLGDNGNTYNGSSSTAFIDPALAVTANDTIYMLCDLYPYGVALNGSVGAYPNYEVGFDSNGRLLLSTDGSNYNYYLDGSTIYSSAGAAVTDYTVDAYFNIYNSTTGEYVSNLFFSGAPYQVARTGFLYLTSSTDKGATWSTPTLLPNLKTSSERVCLVGPGRGLVTSSGVVIFPCYSFDGDSSLSSSSIVQNMGFIYSTDGINWKRSANFTGATWSSEAAAVELSNGDIRFFYRNSTTNLCYVDYDLDNSSWGTAVCLDGTNGLESVDTNSNCQLSAITYSKTYNGNQVILVSCPTGANYAGDNQSGASYRLNGRIFVFSVDSSGNMTQIDYENVNSKHSSTNYFMYSCLTELKDGSIAILYEDIENNWGTSTTSYYAMSFSTYSADTLNLSGTTAGTDNGLEGVYMVDGSSSVIELDKEITAGETTTITVTGLGENETIIFESSDSAVAEASLSGSTITVTAKDEGSAVITGTVVSSADVSTYALADKLTINVTVNAASTEGGEEEDGNDKQDTIISEATKVTTTEYKYVLDTDGTISTTNPYLIVNTGSDGTGYALTNNSGNATSTTVNISDGTITVDDDTNIAWTFSGSSGGTISNNGYSIYAERGNMSLSTNSSVSFSISHKGNGSYQATYNGGMTDYLYCSNGTWYVKNTAGNVYLYERTSVPSETTTTVWTVDAALQESRIAALTTTNDGYTDASWNAYQAALTAAQSKLTEVENASYASEEAATTALNELVAAVDALEAAKNALEKAITITINYVCDGTTVFSHNANVSEKDESYAIPYTTVTGTDGTIYTVDSDTLALTAGTTTYNVPVTKLEGYAVTVARGSELTVSPADPYGDDSVTGTELTDGQYIKWNSADGSYVGVAGVYVVASNSYTDEADIFGTQVTTNPIVVTGTVYNEDGTVANVYQWLVTVTEAATGTTSVNRYIDVDNVENCTLYYSINGGSLVQVNGTGVSIIPATDVTPYHVIEGTWYGNLSLIFFAAPNTGYAMTHMFIEDSGGQYYMMTDGNGDVTASSAWPFKSDFTTFTYDGVAYTMDQIAARYLANGTSDAVYNAAKGDTSIWKQVDTNGDGTLDTHGLRWALLEGYVTADSLEALYKDAYAKGCTTLTTVTKAASVSSFGASDDPISVCAVAQQLPYVVKKLETSDDQVGLGDVLNYTVTVTIPKTDNYPKYWDGSTLTSRDTRTVKYTNVSISDSLYSDLGLDYTEYTSSTSSNQTETLNYSITLGHDKFDDYVKDGKITNEVTLNYTFSTSVATGTNNSKSSTSAVVSIYLEPVYVIDFGLPMTFTIDVAMVDTFQLATDETLKSASSEKDYANVTITGNNTDGYTVTYTPKTVLHGSDNIYLTDTQNHTFGYCQIIPASNVLYEEGFMTAETGSDTYVDWSATGSKLGDATSQSNANEACYGYDSNYASSTGASGTTYRAELTAAGQMTENLTVDFYGNCFDLIGTCGPDTGYVYLAIRALDAGGSNKVVVIDTSNIDGPFYQVPLAHVELTLGNYTAYVFGGYRQVDSNGMSFFGAGAMGANDDLFAMFDRAYEEGLDFGDVEFVYFDKSSALASYSNSMMMYADTGSSGNTNAAQTIVKQVGGIIEIDGFRVYRSANEQSYVAAENGVEYTNVIDAQNNGFIGYIEGDSGEFSQNNVYENAGGPQNEIYLMPQVKNEDGNVTKTYSVTFQTTLTAGATVQVSARAVTNATKMNATEIKANTELYYEVTVGDDGVIVIENNGDNMLAICNIKAPTGSVTKVTQATYAVAFAMLRSGANEQLEAETPEAGGSGDETEVPEIIYPIYTPGQSGVFRPEEFDIEVGSYTLFGQRFVTIKVNASTDVAKLTINGTPLWASNYIWVKQGLADEYVYTMLLIVPENEAAFFEVLAYNEDGLASKAYTITD